MICKRTYFWFPIYIFPPEIILFEYYKTLKYSDSLNLYLSHRSPCFDVQTPYYYTKPSLRFGGYEARTHQLDGVFAYLTQGGHQRALNNSTTRLRHAILR